MSRTLAAWAGALGALTACTAPAQDVPAEVAAALIAHDVDAVMARVHARYADPRGNRDDLAVDLADLGRSFDRIRVEYSDLSVAEGESAREVTLTGKEDAEWVGAITWRVVGPAQLAMIRDDGWKVRSGLLTHFRDIRALMMARRAALERNDAAAIGDLLHPNYRDGDLDGDDVVARLSRDLQGAAIRIQPTNYRLQLRGPEAHLDEHYVLTVAGQRLDPQIARFTLARSAGRWRIVAGLYPAQASKLP